jgi:6-phosphogluconate dehydrogenase
LGKLIFIYKNKIFICKIKVGPSGSGHFVKMVHNGIEYGDMQLIGEVYNIMKDILKMSNDEIASV